MQPSPTAETSKPLFPSFRFSISFSCDATGQLYSFEEARADQTNRPCHFWTRSKGVHLDQVALETFAVCLGDMQFAERSDLHSSGAGFAPHVVGLFSRRHNHGNHKAFENAGGARVFPDPFSARGNPTGATHETAGGNEENFLAVAQA
jgi:hypothetical protein